MKYFQDAWEQDLLFTKSASFRGKITRMFLRRAAFSVVPIILNHHHGWTRCVFPQSALAHSVHIGKNIADIWYILVKKSYGLVTTAHKCARSKQLGVKTLCFANMRTDITRKIICGIGKLFLEERDFLPIIKIESAKTRLLFGKQFVRQFEGTAELNLPCLRT